ncbi:DUF1800 domain-containing protein [Lysobacter sp. Root690]|uniref:DUF1800 domain-containing protein n=1 Tax=Lysobacter sp. Root690 TaxID=1736588 RepID=UPI0007014800|nr:DUF1800 domain-containing protein [Lysobacter sp. Root690]KRB02359.1 hypothetical protein ASD86_22675 [Lysobacter sp. Root690]
MAVESDAAAARFLAQATFGPTLEDIAHLRQLGTYERWIDEQIAMPASSHAQYLHTLLPNPPDQGNTDDQRLEGWLQMSLGGVDGLTPGLTHRDQLRQRVAFALSEILVISATGVQQRTGYSTSSYYDVLVNEGLGNYRKLLEDVTLHPAMGVYLSMLGNEKPDPALNIRPDENYAREVMQLFSVGLVRLNADGTPVLVDGQSVATYDQDTIGGFAHVFTGWSYEGCRSLRGCKASRIDPVRERPMVAYPQFHASAQSKQLLRYPGVALANGVLPAGGTAQSDLGAALDNIFRHPNVGPFIGRQLIQRLVTSNPSPAYVARVSAVFADNGQGVRGDMKAVVKAILLDPEARTPSAQPSHFGKVREPMLRLTHLYRAFNARSRNGRYVARAPDFYQRNLGQIPLGSPSVFNFFRPDFVPIGEMGELGLAAPELTLANDSLIPAGNNLIWDLVRGFHTGATGQSDTAILLDFSRDLPLAADPNALLDRYNLLFLSGQMSPAMRQVLLNHLNGVRNNDGGLSRVQRALYLILNSPEYNVQK